MPWATSLRYVARVLANESSRLGLGTQTPSRAFASPIRNAGSAVTASPSTARPPHLTSRSGRQCQIPLASVRQLVFEVLGANSATSGPPIAHGLNVKLVTPRPGGVAPGSEMLAAAHTMSAGHFQSSSSRGVMCVFDSGKPACLLALDRDAARPTLPGPVALFGIEVLRLDRFSAKAVQRRRR